MSNEPTEADIKFALAYVSTGSARRAYIASCGEPILPDYDTCAVRGASRLRSPGVKREVARLRDEAAQRFKDATQCTPTQLLHMFYEIATADPNELIELRVGCCRYCHGEGHQYQWREHEYMAELDRWEALPVGVKALSPMPDIKGGLGFDHTVEPSDDCPSCRGEGLERVVPKDTRQLSTGAKRLYRGVKQTRNGLEIQMADQTTALENLGRLMGAFKDTVKVDASVRAVTTALTDPAQAQAAYLQMLEAGGANS